jgi:MFS transporter, DHA1 family, inner membrane transport protein
MRLNQARAIHLNEAPVAKGLVPLLTLATFANHLNVIAWNPFLPFIAAELSVTVAILGQIPALMMLLSASFGLIIGPLADYYGCRRTLLVCLLAVATSGLTTGLAGILPILVLAAFVGAIGRAAIMPIAQAIVARSFVDEAARRRAVSRIQNGGPLAATMGIPLLTASAAALPAALQWRGAFFMLSGGALVTALILRRILPQDENTGNKSISLQNILAAYQTIVQHRYSLTLIAAACLEQAGTWTMWTYYGAFYVAKHAFSTQQVGWVSLAAGLGVLVGQTAAGGRLGSHPRLLFIVGCLASGPLIGFSLILPVSALTAVALMTAGWLMHGPVMVTAVVLLVGHSPAGRATTLTLYGSAMNLGITIGAALGGLALARIGYGAVGLGALALTLLSATLVWCCPGPEQAPA